MTRARELGITIGRMPTGPFNAITDVPGILVGHETIVADEPYVVRTGVTMIVPREGGIWTDSACAGFFSLNGCGEMTGLPWMEESGTLHTPIGITNTNAVGVVRDAIAAYPVDNPRDTPASVSDSWSGTLPVVAETWDGWLNDINRFSVTKEHTYKALRAARGGRVQEGNVGGGTGMICHEFKGGIGTSSRIITTSYGRYTLGVLVQANYGERYLLRVDGVPVGQMLGVEQPFEPGSNPAQGGSIIIIVATDAPLIPGQCTRLAKRAALGLARMGGVGFNGSGDIFLAFATGNHLPIVATAPLDLKMLPHDHLNPFFEATVEAVEESILNALTAAETMVGWQQRTVHALPLDELQMIMRKYRPLR